MLDRDTLRSYATPIAILAVALFLCTGWALSSGSIAPYLLFVPVLAGVGLGVAASTRLDPPGARGSAGRRHRGHEEGDSGAP